MITVHISDVFATTTGTSLQQVNPFLPWHVLNTDHCLPFSPCLQSRGNLKFLICTQITHNPICRYKLKVYVFSYVWEQYNYR